MLYHLKPPWQNGLCVRSWCTSIPVRSIPMIQNKFQRCQGSVTSGKREGERKEEEAYGVLNQINGNQINFNLLSVTVCDGRFRSFTEPIIMWYIVSGIIII